MMSLGIVPKIPYQRIFVLSDPGVPRAFVEDCSLWTSLFPDETEPSTPGNNRLTLREILCWSLR